MSEDLCWSLMFSHVSGAVGRLFQWLFLTHTCIKTSLLCTWLQYCCRIPEAKRLRGTASSGLSVWSLRTTQDVRWSFVSAPLPLRLLRPLWAPQRWCWDAFLLLFQAAQRIRTDVFPLSLPSPPLFILLVDSLLLFQAADLLLLAWTDQLSHLDILDVVQGSLGRFVQHDGVEDDVKQRNSRNILQGCS